MIQFDIEFVSNGRFLDIEVNSEKVGAIYEPIREGQRPHVVFFGMIIQCNTLDSIKQSLNRTLNLMAKKRFLKEV